MVSGENIVRALSNYSVIYRKYKNTAKLKKATKVMHINNLFISILHFVVDLRGTYLVFLFLSQFLIAFKS